MNVKEFDEKACKGYFFQTSNRNAILKAFEWQNPIYFQPCYKDKIKIVAFLFYSQGFKIAFISLSMCILAQMGLGENSYSIQDAITKYYRMDRL